MDFTKQYYYIYIKKINRSFESEGNFDCRLHKRYRHNFKDEAISIISPTYNWGVPSIVKEFLEKVKLNTDYMYFI